MKFALLFVLVAGSCALEYIDDFTVNGKFFESYELPSLGIIIML